jgi:hypothetical protein
MYFEHSQYIHIQYGYKSEKYILLSFDIPLQFPVDPSVYIGINRINQPEMRKTSVINLPSSGIGTHHQLKMHEYLPAGNSHLTTDDLDYFRQDWAYIQASLHADELPGLLVCHHLIKLLDKASSTNSVIKPICIIPFANPMGLSQRILGHHMGRFSLGTGVNFNRDWIDVTNLVCEKVTGQLILGDSSHNVAVIRKALYDEADKINNLKVENVMKKQLFKKAAIASVVLDLHCDSEAIMHMYTHDRLWPEMRDLAALIESRCNLVAGWSGGNPFDEACSCPWATISDKYPDYNIPMACQSATIELRGEADVYDSMAAQDATNIYRFLVHRGYIKDGGFNDSSEIISNYSIPATPLTGVDMIEVNLLLSLVRLLLIAFIFRRRLLVFLRGK